MGPPVKPVIDLVNLTLNQLEKLADKTFVEKQKLMDQWVIKANQKVAEKHAISIGLKPIKGSKRKIKKMLNEKIIQIVQSKKITHLDLALSAQTPRTRITALINRHLSQFSIDAMMQILWILGTDTEIKFVEKP